MSRIAIHQYPSLKEDRIQGSKGNNIQKMMSHSKAIKHILLSSNRNKIRNKWNFSTKAMIFFLERSKNKIKLRNNRNRKNNNSIGWV